MTETVKFRKGLPICSKARQIILNVRYYFFYEKNTRRPEPSYNAFRQRLVKATNVSLMTINRLVSKGNPSINRKRNKPKKVIVTLDDVSVIRATVIQLYKEAVPTLDILTNTLNERNQLSFGQVKRTTLWFILRSIGYHYRKSEKVARKMLMERPDIVVKRREYLRFLNHLRETRPESQIFYLDETWIDSRIFTSKMWCSNDSEFTPNLTGGKRYIVIHAGSRNGFVPNGLKIFTTTEVDGDYHKSMNAVVFTDWFTNQLLPNIPPNSIIVMDNAPYHSVLLEKKLNSANRVADIREWLLNKGIAFDSTMTKVELLALVKLNFKKTYVIDNQAANLGHKIVRLPPYYCELNPIELVWASVKQYVRKHNVSNGNDIDHLISRSFDQINSGFWAKCVDHCDKLANDYWKFDYFIDDLIDSFGNLSVDEDEDCSHDNEDESDDEVDMNLLELPDLPLIDDN